MNRARARSWLFAGSFALAFLLQLMPLPQRAAAAQAVLARPGADVLGDRDARARRPRLRVPARPGRRPADGELLGEQALRLCVLAFIVLRFRARLRFFPMWQQALAVLALLLNDRVVMLMVRGFAGEPMPPAEFWLAPLVGMLAWPFVFLLLRRPARAAARRRLAMRASCASSHPQVAMAQPSSRSRTARHEAALFRRRALAGFPLIVAVPDRARRALRVPARSRATTSSARARRPTAC